MPDPYPLPDAIPRLVDRFAEHIDAYRSGSYNESQVRREFIDPLFMALGWDVNNEQGYAEACKVVICKHAGHLPWTHVAGTQCSCSITLSCKRTALQRDIDHTDRQIDRLVYELSGLTDDERRSVEEATTKQ